jgi:hypothetical protein
MTALLLEDKADFKSRTRLSASCVSYHASSPLTPALLTSMTASTEWELEESSSPTPISMSSRRSAVSSATATGTGLASLMAHTCSTALSKPSVRCCAVAGSWEMPKSLISATTGKQCSTISGAKARHHGGMTMVTTGSVGSVPPLLLLLSEDKSLPASKKYQYS